MLKLNPQRAIKRTYDLYAGSSVTIQRLQDWPNLQMGSCYAGNRYVLALKIKWMVVRDDLNYLIQRYQND